jgi:hypothetical protein
MSSRGRADIDPKGGQPYAAAAMSLVFHAAHPLVPTLRADVRLFQVRAEEGPGRPGAVPGGDFNHGIGACAPGRGTRVHNTGSRFSSPDSR